MHRMASKLMWLVLGVVRVLWCLAPQTGYIHPDEFFQSPEVMAGDILNLKTYRTWEFNTSYPSRSILFPLITTGFSFTTLKALHNSGLFDKILNGYSLLVFPRCYLTCVSFILDYSVYHLACLWGADPWDALTLLSGSHVVLVFYTRTFSNVIEAVLFALLLLLVAMDIKQASVATHSMRKESGNKKHFIGIVLVSGFFNRPTFIGYALIPMFRWLFCDQKGISQFDLRRIVKRFFGLLSSVIATSFLFIVTDALYFGSLLSERAWFLKDGNNIYTLFVNISQHLVLTPVNLILYNLDQKSLIAHGSHPWFTHLTVNSFLLFGGLHLAAVTTGVKTMVSKFACKASGHTSHKGNLENKLPAKLSMTTQITEYLLLVYFIPIVVLSMFSHQEPRYISPLIVPLVILSASKYKMWSWKVVIVVFNLLGSVFFGCLHQGGLIPCLSYLEKVLHSENPLPSQTEHNFIFYHTYMPPRYLLNIKSDEKFVRIIDLGGSDVSFLNNTMNELLDNSASKHFGKNEEINIYMIAPGTVQDDIKNCGFQWKTVASFFPHLTMEDPPDISSLLSEDGLTQLSLYIFKVHIKLKQPEH
ncbi:GPI mannosyltransferase 4-like [Hemiscyllium ocellatum]|uniref:GPI mannosyltransferase 4-like n=1 Tax=Hemiscyllium ocellatum TaxID=170820 RepID=UPI002966C3A8|nr:GPI mannosyltransferase 4-like [Hemiscyllium ocellatum]XP_060690076.1 GPI mannosyltransferase 4-like [Hemiscyllium ocellatum]XP_060690077.1 GPI mannosyltransferase 4-like [Hemiscyllium ocellatum]